VLELWREQHPNGHEQTMLDFKARGAAASQNGVVRRGKALVNSGCKSRPGTGSLHPVAIEAAVEVTKPLEPSM